jgi:hypothetical protein
MPEYHMKAIELVILTAAVIVLIIALAASAIASNSASFLNIHFPTHHAHEPKIGVAEMGIHSGNTLCIAIDAITGAIVDSGSSAVEFRDYDG